jgi:PPK2 family polyphosphate:nucleotide phosphotransferase
MKIEVKNFCVEEGKKIKLKNYPTIVKPFYKNSDEYKRIQDKHFQKINELQNIFYSYKKYALLLIFQGMDASGKDGAIKHVMKGVSPEGSQTYSFKQPSTEELDHDFFWRIYKALPERGRIGIFNRSYYEEVLIVKVHPEILKSQELPPELMDEKKIWKSRYRSIVDIEKHLYNNGTKIIKFFLHLSEEEQRRRFLSRIDEPEKNWKFNIGDIKEREFWRDYMMAYEECITKTSTQKAPWYLIPADDKGNARIIISQIICNELKKLNLSYPVTDAEREKELQEIRGVLVQKESIK